MAAADANVQAVHAAVGRLLSEPDYAEQVKQDGVAALQAGPGSDAWTKYFDHFAASPGALSNLGSSDAASCTCNSNTIITLSSLVTPVPTCCAATTTTTTSNR